MSKIISENVAVIQLTSDTLSIEYQKGDGEGLTPLAGAAGVAPGTGGAFSVEGEQVVRCDISIKGFHFQVSEPRHYLVKNRYARKDTTVVDEARTSSVVRTRFVSNTVSSSCARLLPVDDSRHRCVACACCLVNKQATTPDMGQCELVITESQQKVELSLVAKRRTRFEEG